MEAENITLADNATITASSHGAGRAGDIRMNANRLFMNKGAAITSDSRVDMAGSGDAGNISVRMGSRVGLHKGSTMSTTTAGGGDAGNIFVRADTITLDSRGTVLSDSTSQKLYAGRAGNIRFHTDDLVMTAGGSVTTMAARADGGNIVMDIDDIGYMLDSGIITSVNTGGGNGGNITIGNPVFFIMNRSRIIANAWGGRGGNIDIRADYFLRSADSIVEASSRFGSPGVIDITSLSIDLTRSLVSMPEDFLDASQWASTPCAARSGADVSSLVVLGRDAAPTSPADLLACPGYGPGIPETDDNPDRRGDTGSPGLFEVEEEEEEEEEDCEDCDR
ncbi:MAG: hypothetical protein GY859_42335 [Desulfobacterales bacterium]|nr:hypothetical protein [Desulfobacterales bacterium]